jgi:hypothetical protein
VVTPGIVKVGDPSILGTKVTQVISGGDPNGYYTVTLTIGTSAGNIYEKAFIIRIVSDVLPTFMSTLALVSLADVKAYIGKETDEDTAVLETIINSVSAVFNGYTKRNLAKQTYTAVYLDGNGQERLYLPNWPITVVTSLYEDNVLMVAGENSNYLLYADDGYVLRMPSGAVWMTGPKKIKITYDAGYVCLTGTITLPFDLKFAALKQIAYEFSQYSKKTWGESARSFADGSISIEIPGLLKDVQDILWRYRRPLG